MPYPFIVEAKKTFYTGPMTDITVPWRLGYSTLREACAAADSIRMYCTGQDYVTGDCFRYHDPVVREV